jgi:hypothetical protein
MFRTIQQQSGGGRSPEWLSSHPDPGNRYEKINREASLLRVAPNPIKITRDFSRTQERLRALPRARSMAQIEQNSGNSRGSSPSPVSAGQYSSRVASPSTRVRAYSGAERFRMNVPVNWREFASGNEVSFAPEGGYGQQGITHGAMAGLVQSNSGGLDQATRDYVDELLQGNSYLRRRGGSLRTTINGQAAYTTQLSGRSPITGRNEIVTVYTAMTGNSELFYLAAVSPESESPAYASAFRSMINSVRLDR